MSVKQVYLISTGLGENLVFLISNKYFNIIFFYLSGQCGFCVCLDCFRERIKCFIRVWTESTNKSADQISTQDKRDSFYWFHCTTEEKEHDFTQLFLTQIIPGDALEILNKQLHETCKMWGITEGCGCELSKNCSKKAANKEMLAMEGTSMMDKDILLKEIVKGNIQKTLKTKYKMSSSESKFMFPKVIKASIGIYYNIKILFYR